MPSWEFHRSHRYYRESDLVFFEIHGDFTLDDIQHLYAVVDPVESEYGYVLIAFDGHDSGSLTPAARRYVGERNRGYQADGGTVIIGASFAIRTLIHLLRNAARLFGKRSAPMLFCATTEEALQWLAVQRQRCRALRTEPRARS